MLPFLLKVDRVMLVTGQDAEALWSGRINGKGGEKRSVDGWTSFSRAPAGPPSRLLRGGGAWQSCWCPSGWLEGPCTCSWRMAPPLQTWGAVWVTVSSPTRHPMPLRARLCGGGERAHRRGQKTTPPPPPTHTC